MTRRPWESTRASRHARGYGRVHVRLRALLLAQEPLCRMCTAKGRVTPATIADHVTPLAAGGERDTLENLQPLCAECHTAKTLKDQGKRAKRRVGLDGWPEE